MYRIVYTEILTFWLHVPKKGGLGVPAPPRKELIGSIDGTYRFHRFMGRKRGAIRDKPPKGALCLMPTVPFMGQ